MLFNSFPFIPQGELTDCGPTCLMMISKWYGKHYSLQYLREQTFISREGVSLLGLSVGAEKLGFRTLGLKLPYISTQEQDGLIDMPVPCIAHWQENHFVVIYKVNEKYAWVSDPARGRIKIDRNTFEKGWKKDNEAGYVLGLEPTPNFYQYEEEKKKKASSIFTIFSYLIPFKGIFAQIFLGFFITFCLQFLTPFLTQSVMDVGIQNHNKQFLGLVLLGQVIIFMSQTLVGFIQSFLMAQVSTRVNVNLVIDYLMDLMRLPIRFFDTKMTGDLMQRIFDQQRIESFLTQTSITTIFSLVSFIVFSGILALFNVKIFVFFMILTTLYFVWIAAFQHQRKKIDTNLFTASSENQQQLMEMINGMQEIKLQGSEKKRRGKWINIQAKLFRLHLKSLKWGQYQEGGAAFIHQIKNIMISFFAATEVINGNISLGTMLSLQYIIGQIDAPIHHFIQFIRMGQDASLSFQRLQEIQNVEPEDNRDTYIDDILIDEDINIKNLSFRYTEIDDWALDNINITLKRGSKTAIVGTSGSGKTTLLKLLLGFYRPTNGKISLGKQNLENINKSQWRKLCGVVSQDGFIFSDTIANNISESDTYPNQERLQEAIEVANLTDVIERLPNGTNSKIGQQGAGLSLGQKQRLLIARAVYKSPKFLFFDEATNALDANNEKQIVDNLEKICEGKTVLTIAHRLSTVRNADQIIVLDKGQLVEEGTHNQLIMKKGFYYNLVRNQLELN